MKSKKRYSLVLTVLFCIASLAQQKTITGMVSDTIGPLPSANVVIKGTTNGVATDFDGKYSIQTKVGAVLVYSFAGYETQKVTVGSHAVINVKLQEVQNSLDEVVITAYGIKKETKKLAYSTQKVATSKVQNKIIGVQISQLAPNVNYINASPQNILNNPTVILPGSNSVNRNTDILFILDGKPISKQQLDSLDPNRISTLTVLKEKEAISIYGSKAKNGAILITSKDTNFVYEEYNSFIENTFESTRTAPLSTFSIDVDNASYANVRRFINNGQKVPKDAVRVEEMVNYFKYTYPQPLRENPFSINTEFAACPWNPNSKIVRIGLQGKDILSSELPASNLVFLIDVSGSMSDQNKLPLLKESLKILVKQLRKEDTISIVVYAGAAGLVLKPTNGDKKREIIAALDNLNAGGSTAGGEGIELAYKITLENFKKNGNNRVILATDGDFNVGASSNSDMETLVTEKRKSGVFLTCLGYGMGNYKDSKMETLADKGNGNYAYIDTIQEANRFLGKEFKGSMFAIAKDVKIQIEFNPNLIQAYRLIGYENRKLRAEDFKNDAIDAGELGSGHTVTALYEVLPVGEVSDFYNAADALKYTENKTLETQFKDEIATIQFRYKKPDGGSSILRSSVIKNQAIVLEKTSEDFKFCTAVAWFGLVLRDSKYLSNKSTEAIVVLASQGITNDNDGYRAEFIRLVEAVVLK
jgi:Ca-activated chloride channel family protein